LFAGLLCVLCCLSHNAYAQSGDFTLDSVNETGDLFTAQFTYPITPADTELEQVRDWRIDIGYNGNATLNNAWMNSFAGTVVTGNIGPNGISARARRRF